MKDPQRRTAIVTGASRGIGKETAKLLAANDINVVVNYFHDSEGARQTVQEIEQNGGTAIAMQHDISKPAEITKLFDATLSQFGEINILVNNAGAFLSKPIKDITEEDFDKIFSTNVKSVFFTMKEASSKMADNSRIINLSSSTTRVLFPTFGLYSASKAAVEQATKIFAKEMGNRGISVNAVLPGPTKTKMILAGKTEADIKQLSSVAAFNRMGEPEDIARVILLLVSEEANWINAQAIGANGGFI